jgi:NADH-quinone oxidoreductase subunit G
MARSQAQTITFTIDGREVQAPENTMLVDAAKMGDVEIPVFCYERKLGEPVGACRMCLVEIEGIGKLQTGCSTPVKDGMVVHTQTDRVKEAQRSVVEFLLVNHPLDCPVCDKGGECPLQDISYGWGGGISRFTDPKRHFVKPLELSPRIAIDRERCILCYRCVRFSQEIAEDYQLVILDRGAESFISTFDGHPYVAPFSGNIVELCPVGALTSLDYRFRARPWDNESAGTVCTLCPAQCNVTLTVRDESVMRVLARENSDVDDGWLCDAGRFAYPPPVPARDGAAGAARGNGHADAALEIVHVGPPTRPTIERPPGAAASEATYGARATASARAAPSGERALGTRVTEPLLRDGGMLRAVSWERALEEAAHALRRARGRTGALVGGGVTNEEGLLFAQLMREALDSPHVDSRAAGALELEHMQDLADARLQATVSDLEFAHAVLVLDCDPVTDAPILDLRVRKGVRRHHLELAHATGADLDALAKAANALREAGDEIVVLWGERFTDAPDGNERASALLDLARTLGLADVEGAGLLEIPARANGRGLREAGVLPNARAGLESPDAQGLDARGIARALAGGELDAMYLLGADPLHDADPLSAAARERGERSTPSPDWDAALARASTVVAHASILTEGVHAHADVVFPAEAYAMKEGTVTHPDGRLQRVRQAVARTGARRSELAAIVELASLLGLELGVGSAREASQRLFESVPFYAGVTLEEIGPRGVRWQERADRSKIGQPA